MLFFFRFDNVLQIKLFSEVAGDAFVGGVDGIYFATKGGGPEGGYLQTLGGNVLSCERNWGSTSFKVELILPMPAILILKPNVVGYKIRLARENTNEVKLAWDEKVVDEWVIKNYFSDIYEKLVNN